MRISSEKICITLLYAVFFFITDSFKNYQL